MLEGTNAIAPGSALEGQTGVQPTKEMATAPAPATTEGRASEPKQDEGRVVKTPEPTTPTEERFLTLDDVPEDERPLAEKLSARLEKEYKAAYTKKTQAIANDRRKIEIYDQFEKDPINTLTSIAQQYGLQISRANQNQQQQGQQSPVQQDIGPDWQPETWDQVLEMAEQRAEQRILTKLRPILEPVIGTVEKIKSDTIETTLDKIDANWKLYEDEIKANMALAPALIQNPAGIAKLYRMSVPEDVLTSRATQAALKKFEEKAKAASVESKSHAQQTTPAYKGGGSFQDAVDAAKRQLANQ
jgi:hypothetical protein